MSVRRISIAVSHVSVSILADGIVCALGNPDKVSAESGSMNSISHRLSREFWGFGLPPPFCAGRIVES